MKIYITSKTQDTACATSPQTPFINDEPRNHDRQAKNRISALKLHPTTRKVMQPHLTSNQHHLGNTSLFTANAVNSTHQTEPSQGVPSKPTDLTCCWIHQ
jgi:hypothetical protein